MIYKIQISTGPRPGLSGTVFSTFLLAGALLLGPGKVQLCAYQFPPYPTTVIDGGMTNYDADEMTFSMGVFQITVNTNFAYLFAPVNALGHFNPSGTYYPGYSPNNNLLTSPTLYDFNQTIIGTGGMSPNGQADIWPGTYSTTPVTIGSTLFASDYPGNTIQTASFAPWGAYYVMPSQFAFAGFPAPQIYTEIEAFDLECSAASDACGQDERVPAPPNTELDMVSAGPNSYYGFAATDPTQLPIRSIGMVQATQTSAAESFFAINVLINLPEVTATATAFDFPPPTAMTLGTPALKASYITANVKVAQLTNDPTQPLIIINTNVPSLPPQVVYIHGMTTSVPLYFAAANPGFWNQGDLFGWVTLAGHGVFTNCQSSVTGDPQGTNGCCQQATAAGFLTTLLDQALGPVGTPKPGMPVPFTRPTNSFPTPGSYYNSIVHSVVNNGVSNDLSATVSFTFPGVTIPIGYVSLGTFPNSIALPPANATSTYTASNVDITFQLSVNGTWFPASGTNTSMTMVISNTGSANPGLNYTNPPPQTYYTVQMTAFRSDSTWADGTFHLIQNPTNVSLGNFTVAKAAGGGYTVASELKANLEASTDNETFFSASGALQLVPNSPPATPGTITPTLLTATQVALNWNGDFILQSTTDLRSPWTNVSATPIWGPYTNITTGVHQQFFRLAQ